MTLELLPRRVEARRQGAVWYLASPEPLAEPPATLLELLRRGATGAPDRDFLIERTARTEGELRRVTYAEALAEAEAIGSWLVAEGHTSVTALSGNSVDLALLMLGCFCAGVPFVPVSPAYTRLSRDFAKLDVVLAKAPPSLIYAATPDWPGLARAAERSGARTTAAPGRGPARPLPIVGPGHVAKILFTSGSTGAPKAVPNTHRMLCANQQMIAQCWPFLADPSRPPVLVDWLPWSHTFGGNHNFNLVLMHQGTLLVDEGRPPTVEPTLRNLEELPPTLYFNVPAGYAALVPRLEASGSLARAFFSRLRVMFYAAAALPPDLWRRLVALAERHAPEPVFMTTAWGSTETAPLATSAHFPLEAAGNVGLPAPGVTLKLVPNGAKLEVRVKGPSVMDGYLDEPAQNRAVFDEEGFYKIGDAVRFADPADPAAGLLFDGRVAEDFKLATGTWVSVTHLRTGIAALGGGLLADVVVCGQDKEALGVLAWPGPNAPAGPELHERLADVLRRWNQENPASSTRVTRALVLTDPPSIDAGEITDKGYVNQRATQERRATRVAALFADPPGPDVLCLDRDRDLGLGR